MIDTLINMKKNKFFYSQWTFIASIFVQETSRAIVIFLYEYFILLVCGKHA